jgi:hypothetical protein
MHEYSDFKFEKCMYNLFEYTPVLEGESLAVEPKLPRENCEITAKYYCVLDNIQKIQISVD